MPSFKITQSNSFNVLAAKLAKQIRDHSPGDPFEKQYIIVQTAGMHRWLAMETAKTNRIFSNFTFPGPDDFFRLLYFLIEGRDEKKGVFEPDVLKWAVYSVIRENLDTEKSFQILKKYAQDDEMKLYQLSTGIADLYDQYMVYRPDMILKWNDGKKALHTKDSLAETEEWQMRLWELIREKYGTEVPDKVVRREKILDGLTNGSEDVISRIPKRVHIFGLSVLSEYYLTIFEACAIHADVHFYLMNPSRKFWGTITDEKRKARIQARAVEIGIDPEQLHLDEGNPLLASMGRTGKEFFDLLVYNDRLSDVTLEGDWLEPGNTSVLSTVQTDILNLVNRKELIRKGEEEPIILGSNDRSLSVASCHSPLREVEVLKDILLDEFCRNPALSTDDILVVSPKIDEYAPYIEMVFSKKKGKNEPDTMHIPYSIADRSFSIENSVAGITGKILDLPLQRAEASSIVSIFESEPVRERFGISEEDMARIRLWVRSSGIRWGVDAAYRKSLGLPEYNENSWESGIDRMIAGYCMDTEKEEFYNGILPLDGLEGSSADIAGKFVTAVGVLFRFIKKSHKERSVSDWRDILTEVIDSLFATGRFNETSDDVASMHKTLTMLADSVAAAFENEKVPYAVFRKELAGRLETFEVSTKFRAGGVTFSSMVPMRSIPFKMICMLGMNETDFPRRNRYLDFDLMQYQPRKGDRRPRENDRYLFLEMILSAKERLYISYVGRSIKDNAQLYPAAPVSELLEYIDTGFVTGDKDVLPSKGITVGHPLQPFCERYFDGSSDVLFSYSAENCIDTGDLEKTGLIAALPQPSDDSELFAISGRELEKFFRDPAEYFYKSRIRALIPGSEEQINDEESFKTDNLQDYFIRKRCIESILADGNNDETLENTFNKLAAEGNMPFGTAKETVYKRDREDAVKIFEYINEYTDGFVKTDIEQTLNIDGVEIRAAYRELYISDTEKRAVTWHPSKLKVRYRVGAWIRHLLLNRLMENVTTCYIALDGTEIWEPVGDAGELLGGFIGLYKKGLVRPLMFLPETSFAYMEAKHEIETGKKRPDPIKEAEDKFYDRYFPGEGNRSEYSRWAYADNDPFKPENIDEFTTAAETVFKGYFSSRADT